MNLRGKILQCEKCGMISLWENNPDFIHTMDDGNQMLIIEMSKKLLPYYNAEKHGYFKYEPAICEHCIDDAENVIVLSDDNIIIQYIKTELGNHPEFIEAKKELQNLEEKVIRYLIDNQNSKFYNDVEIENERGLFPPKRSGLTFESPEKIGIDEKFYACCDYWVEEIIGRLRFKKRY